MLDPDIDLSVRRSSAGRRWFEIRGLLPGDTRRPPAVVAIREVWRDVAVDVAERMAYEYELQDQDRDVRRAWHLHDRQFFADRFQVLVHEHCERPIGVIRCKHYAGYPVRDAFAAVELVVRTWVDPESPDCDALTCLDS